MKPDITLVIGGVRSGKSRFAADLASRRAGGAGRSFSWLQRGAGQERAWRLESKITAPADPTIGRQ